MPPHAPDGLVPFLRQPLVAQVLRIKVVDLERGVVDVRCVVLVQEEAVVVHVLFAAVDVRKQSNVLPLGILVRLHPEEVGRDDVEVARIEFA